MSFGAKILATLRALGLFGGVWVILAGVAWGAGVLPDVGDNATESDAAPADPAGPSDGGGGTAGDGSADDTSPQEAGDNDDSPAPGDPDGTELPAPVPVAVDDEARPGVSPLASPLATSVAIQVCDDPLAPVSVTAGQLLGDDATELIVSCGNEVNVLARAGRGIMRVAQIRDASSTPAREARVALADLGGDGRGDLLVGFIGTAASASASRLAVVAGDERGGLSEPQVLAPISALSLDSGELDGRPGSDLVALHQADGFGRRPSEAWVIAGGPSPVRTHRQILHAGGHALAILDLDGDSNIDVLSADSRGLFQYLGDGAGRLASGTAFSTDVVTHLAVRSREDERQIAWSVGAELVLSRGQPEPTRQDLGEEVRGLQFDPNSRPPRALGADVASL